MATALVPRVFPEPAANVVETLEKWLAYAKAGELRAIFLTGIHVDKDGEGSICAIDCGKNVWRDALVGAVERGKWMAFDVWTAPR